MISFFYKAQTQAKLNNVLLRDAWWNEVNKQKKCVNKHKHQETCCLPVRWDIEEEQKEKSLYTWM